MDPQFLFSIRHIVIECSFIVPDDEDPDGAVFCFEAMTIPDYLVEVS